MPDAVSTAPGPADLRKRLANCKARCALVGGVLHELIGDDGRPEYIVTKWALTRAFRSLDELEAWLPRVEGRAP